MEVAKIVEEGKDQIVLLPEQYRFKDVEEVVVQRLGDAVLLVPKEHLWQTFLEGVNGFTGDIFEDGRNQGGQQERS